MMSEMYNSYNKVIAIIDNVFNTFVSSSEEDRYIASVNRASFILNTPQILMDLERIGAMSADDIEGFVPKYVENFSSAYKQSFIVSSGFGEATASRYSHQAASSMMEIIDSYLAMR